MTNASNNSSASHNNGRSSNFIDLHTSGLGYISRVREVPVRKGKPFMAASIRAMHGEKGVEDGIQYVPFDVKAMTPETIWCLKELAGYANSDSHRVMVQFKIGDFYIDTFRYTTGTKAGETATMLKGRLLQIYAVWVKEIGDGNEQSGWNKIYDRKAEMEAQAKAEAEAAQREQNPADSTQGQRALSPASQQDGRDAYVEGHSEFDDTDIPY